MYCKKIILINWGNIPNLEFEFGPINLFSGGNGSGKTTAADALQSLMTASYENLFNYNPGQDETTQRGRGGKQVRTLASYILGCDDGSYARVKPTDGYIVGVFHPTNGETGTPFSAIMAVRAALETTGKIRQARQRQLTFYIVNDEQVDITLFEKSGQVTNLDHFAFELRSRYGKDKIETFEKKGQYLNRLYGAMRDQKGSVSKREAQHAAKTFSSFMAYKPVKSINDFVAREILKPRDLSEDIKQVSELMKTIHSMETEETLTKLNTTSDKRALIHTQLVELEAQRQGIPALKDKDQLEKAIEKNRQKLVDHALPLLEQDKQLLDNQALCEQLKGQSQASGLGLDAPAVESKEFLRDINAVIELNTNTGIDMPSLVNHDFAGIANLESKLDNLIDYEKVHNAMHARIHLSGNQIVSIRDSVFEIVNTRKQKQSRLQEQVSQKKREVQLLENATVSYPSFVEAALKAINQKCPQARPAVLCDFINVTEPEWQMAIEGYIGGSRFCILVEPEFEAEATRIVRAMPGRRNSAKVIQGWKAQRDANKLSVAPNSILDVMTFDHKISEYYIKAAYGSVIRVADAQELRETSRGITPDGLGSGSYSMFRCDIDDSNLVFGKGARERALAAKELQLQELETNAFSAEKSARQAAVLLDIIDKIKPISLSKVVRDMLNLQREIEQDEQRIKAIDLSDYGNLEKELETKRNDLFDIDQLSGELRELIGTLNANSKTLAKRALEISNTQDILQEQQEAAESSIENIAENHPDFDVSNALQSARNFAEQHAKLSDANDSFIDELEQYQQKCNILEKQIDKDVMLHNQECRHEDKILVLSDTAIEGAHSHNQEWFKRVTVIFKDTKLILNRLKYNVLVGKHEKLSGLRDSFNTAFVTNLCHSIYQSINDGKRTLDELNKELESHLFGTDQERYHFGYSWVPEFQEYQRFFKDVINVPSLGDGNSLFDAELSEKSTRVRDKLLAMLLDNDEQVAQRELTRLSDYRHYRAYEIYKTPKGKESIALSQYGTGSGGQLETPAYIIRSAAVTSAFKFNEGSSHCRMVLVDEAFSKMDEARSREVIDYLTNKLGLQLIFIMPTSKSGPFMDLISHQTIFSKCPTLTKVGELDTQVLVDRKTCNPEKIKELWAQHRRHIRVQTSLEFMQDFIEQDTGVT